MEYQIQNNLGEVIIESVTEEELEKLRADATAEGINYFFFDATEENDLVTRWAADTEVNYAGSRIIKRI